MDDTPHKEDVKNIPINIFECTEIDFNPVKQKKRRNIDEYDYNDPFIESFEGEFDVVELECKLENFFVYKGKIEEDPKRISRRYNNAQKRKKNSESMKLSETGELTEVPKLNGHGSQSEQKEVVSESINSQMKESENNKIAGVVENCLWKAKPKKCKKDVKLENAVHWLVYTATIPDCFEQYAKDRALEAINGKESVSNTVPDEYKSRMHALQNEVESAFQDIKSIIEDGKNYKEGMKIFENFRDNSFVDKLVRFLTRFIMFRCLQEKVNVRVALLVAMECLMNTFPATCSNKIKLKHHIMKNIFLKIENNGYDLDKAMAGEFVKKAESEAQSIFEPESSTKPSLNDSALTFGNSMSEDVKKYTQPTHTVYSASFFNTTQYKTGPPRNDDRIVIFGEIEGVDDFSEQAVSMENNKTIDFNTTESKGSN